RCSGAANASCTCSLMTTGSSSIKRMYAIFALRSGTADSVLDQHFERLHGARQSRMVRLSDALVSEVTGFGHGGQGLVSNWTAIPERILENAFGIPFAWAPESTVAMSEKNGNVHLTPLREALILSSIGDGVIAADADLRVSFMNPAAEHLTGMATHEALGQPL